MSLYSNLTTANSVLVDGYQVAIESDRTKQFARRISNTQFALPVEDGEEYFWIVVRSLLGDACVYVAINSINSQSSWVLDQGREMRFDHQPGGDKGRFCIVRHEDRPDLVTAYAEAGVTGPLSIIDLEFHPLIRSQAIYRPRLSISDFGGAMRGMSDFSETYGVSRGVSLGASKGVERFDEAIVATAGESSMSTRKVEREEDDSAPIIKLRLEIVAEQRGHVRIPNPSPSPRATFSW